MSHMGPMKWLFLYTLFMLIYIMYIIMMYYYYLIPKVYKNSLVCMNLQMINVMKNLPNSNYLIMYDLNKNNYEYYFEQSLFTYNILDLKYYMH